MIEDSKNATWVEKVDRPGQFVEGVSRDAEKIAGVAEQVLAHFEDNFGDKKTKRRFDHGEILGLVAGSIQEPVVSGFGDFQVQFEGTSIFLPYIERDEKNSSVVIWRQRGPRIVIDHDTKDLASGDMCTGWTARQKRLLEAANIVASSHNLDIGVRRWLHQPIVLNFPIDFYGQVDPRIDIWEGEFINYCELVREGQELPQLKWFKDGTGNVRFELTEV